MSQQVIDKNSPQDGGGWSHTKCVTGCVPKRMTKTDETGWH